MVLIYLIRHAQSEFNATGIDSPNVALTQLGTRQAIALGTMFRERGIAFDHVFVSPLQRALQTYSLANPICDHPPIISHACREQLMGAWANLMHGENSLVNVIESTSSLETRAKRFIEYAKMTATPLKHGRIAIFTHQGFIYALTGRMLQNAEYAVVM